MSRDIAVAKRYARALFDVARDQQKIDAVEKDLRLIVETEAASSDLRTLLEHPGIAPEVKKNVLAALFEGKVTDAVYNVLRLLVDRKREDILPHLLNDYVKIADEARGQATAVVSTPFPLTAEESQEIAAQFGKLTGKTIRVENVIDSSLLGGLQVRIGDKLYDGSLSGKLNRLRKSLIGSQAL